MEPDLLVEQGTQRWVVDSKWKRIDAGDREGKYGLGQADFYQLYAYGKKYLSGNGEMVLIYPKCSTFLRPLPVFDFGDGLRLWALPFDLDGGRLIHEGLTSLRFRSDKVSAPKPQSAANEFTAVA